MTPSPDTFLDLFAGYTVIWTLIAVFVLRLRARQGELERQLSQIREQLHLPKTP